MTFLYSLLVVFTKIKIEILYKKKTKNFFIIPNFNLKRNQH